MDEVSLFIDDGVMEVGLDLTQQWRADLLGNVQFFHNCYPILLYNMYMYLSQLKHTIINSCNYQNRYTAHFNICIEYRNTLNLEICKNIFVIDGSYEINLTKTHAYYILMLTWYEVVPMKIFQHENLSHESFITRKFPDLWYRPF